MPKVVEGLVGGGEAAKPVFHRCGPATPADRIQRNRSGDFVDFNMPANIPIGRAKLLTRVMIFDFS